MTPAAEIDAVLEHDQLRVDSVWKLGERARAGDIEAQFCAIIAAGVFTGLRYSLQEYPAALEDLGREVNERRWSRWQRRNAKPLDPTAEYEAMRVTYGESDREVLTEIDHAIRSWEDQLAIPDEEIEMGTKTLTSGGAAAGIPETQDEAAIKEAEAAGRAMKWDDWLKQSRKIYGREFTPDQVERLRGWYQGGLGPVIAVSGLEDPSDQEESPTPRTIDVNITKGTGIVADLTVGKSGNGFCWTGHVELDGKDATSQPDGGKQFECEEAAIDAAFAWLKGWLEQLRELNPSKANKVRKAIAEADIHRVRLIGPWLRNQKAAPAVELSGLGPAAPSESSSIADAVWEHVEAPLALVDDNPDNTRQNFDDASLAETAESMQLVGQIQACLARRKGDRFQLIDGGRRKRAAAIAGRQTLRLDLVPDSIDDATAIEIMGRANEERKEFDPISRALWFQKLLQTRGCTQEELGNRIRVSQGVISNHLRLLELPDCWRKRLIAREISETHARGLIAFVEQPHLLEQLEKAFGKLKEGAPPAREWPRWIADQVCNVTRTCTPGEWVNVGKYSGACLFTASQIKELADELQVIEVPHRWQAGMVKRALNVRKWDQLHSALVKEKENEKPAPKKSGGRGAKSGSTKSSRQAPSAHAVENAIHEWKLSQIAERVDGFDQDTLVMMTVLVCTAGSSSMEFQDVGKVLGVKLAGYGDFAARLWEALLKSDAKKRLLALRAGVKSILASPFGDGIECAKTTAAIAERFDVQYARDWRPTKRTLEGYDEATLRELPAAARTKIAPTAKKEAIIAALLKVWQAGEFPPGYEPASVFPAAAGKKGAKQR